jgi:hypothetical protein
MKEEEAEDADDDEKRGTLSSIQEPLIQNESHKTSSQSLFEGKTGCRALGRARCFLTWKIFCLFGN